MKVLIACEESQVVCKAFRKLGIEAYSCDILKCSGGSPDWHLCMNVLDALKLPGHFKTQAGTAVYVNYWSAVIAFPPCTHLAASGAKHFVWKRELGMQQEGIEFFMYFVKYTECPVALENPVGVMSTLYRKPDQIIQPYQFGHGETKKTCFWLNGFPKLIPTDIVEGREPRIWKIGSGKNQSKLRSKTYPRHS